uniref:Uncharacterized protein n=1 Tax=Arundo donax TaxID=35708 RepID=A0A0A8YVN5_ARUDO
MCVVRLMQLNICWMSQLPAIQFHLKLLGVGLCKQYQLIKMHYS